MNQVRGLMLAICVIALSACASKQEEQLKQADATIAPVDAPLEVQAEASSNNNDPFEPFNRVMWDFNYEVLDRFLLKPVTKGYVAVTPQVLRTGLLNAANNLEEPANSINNMLQGKFESGFTSVGRFAVNSTIGLLGFFDVASSMGLERKREDFGQVLGVWGVGTGPYLMIPALGPSDFRSLTGTVVDRYYWPGTVLEDPYVIGAAVVSLLEARATLIEQEENLNRSLDQYLFVRDAYFQRLAFEVSDGQIEQKSDEELEEEQDDFSDFEALLNGTE
ncbi:VacJ family lipoprotein [Glaciecola sp. 2405UD65-10]|uniref:MlaA family lipoprotein n=1 Tax=Glaciecola sp. 2405UD65-10 TaxID=3397244 RepID=UPI003B5AFE28